MYKSLIALLQRGKAKFHFYKDDLYILTSVQSFKAEDDYIEVRFTGGYIKIWSDSKICRVRRPANLIVECVECYAISNSEGEHIGYILEIA